MSQLSGSQLRDEKAAFELDEFLDDEGDGAKSGKLSPTISKVDGDPWELRWDNIDFRVKLSTKCKPEGAPEEKIILNDVKGYVRTGQLTAIMGPSGAGKTSMLDILANRVSSKAFSGQILINGIDRHSLNKRHYRTSSFVMQDDALYPHLTVRETITYSANLRLPDFSPEARKRRVERVIDELGLTAVADSKIGNHMIRGISGGERRRVSIGVELVVQPRILFMDEPTSGLDSQTAMEVCRIIKQLAEAGRAIVLVIHQPNYEIYSMMDRIYFLSKGNIVFSGSEQLCADFWNYMQNPLPPKRNPADVMLERVVMYERSGQTEELTQKWLDFYSSEAQKHRKFLKESAQAVKSPKKKRKKSLARNMSVLSEVDDPTPLYKDISTNAVKDLHSQMDISHERQEKLAFFKEHRAKNASFFGQLVELTKINALNTVRTKELLFVRLAMYTSISLLLGTIFWRVDGDTQEDVNEWLSFFAFASALMFFPAMENIPIHMDNKSIFLREYGNGYYGIVPFVLAEFLVIIPAAAAISLCFSLWSYWMVGLQEEVDLWFLFWFVNFGAMLAAQAFVVFVSALAREPLIANSLGTTIFAFMFLFSGFFIPRSQIEPWWIWFHYLSLFKYAIEALVKNQFDDNVGPFTCEQSVISQPGLENCMVTSEEVLQGLDMENVSILGNVGVLISYAILYKFLWAVVLVLQGTKRK